MRIFIMLIMLALPLMAFADDITITAKTSEKAMSKADAEKLMLLTDTIRYDEKTGIRSYDYNEAKGCGWKLVHDGKRVVTVQNNCGIMTTMHTIVTAKDKAAILKEIDLLGLTVSDDVAEQIEMEE